MGETRLDLGVDDAGIDPIPATEWNGVAYILVQNDDLWNVMPDPKITIEWVKGRATANWRGRRFTVPAPRPRFRW